LWRKLVKKFGNDHASNRLNQLLDNIDNSTNLPLERISFFGISSLLPVHLKVFQKLSEKIEINLYFFDTGVGQNFKSQNDLLSSWGMIGRDFLKSLSDIKSDEFMDCTSKNSPKSVLSQIQFDILNNIDSSNNKPLVFDSDNSLTVVSCHSKVREIEILHNHLLCCFDADGLESLKPDEILIMAPNISDYAVYIDAIFGNPLNAHKIPFSIADVKTADALSCSAQFISLLDVLSSRFEASEIISLLDFAPIRERFDIAEQDLEYIKVWVEESGIRWAINGDHKRDISLPALCYY